MGFRGSPVRIRLFRICKLMPCGNLAAGHSRARRGYGVTKTAYSPQSSSGSGLQRTVFRGQQGACVALQVIPPLPAICAFTVPHSGATFSVSNDSTCKSSICSLTLRIVWLPAGEEDEERGSRSQAPSARRRQCIISGSGKADDPQRAPVPPHPAGSDTPTWKALRAVADHRRDSAAAGEMAVHGGAQRR